MRDRDSYGSVNNFELEDGIDIDLDYTPSIKATPNKNRWSVLEKLDNRHYCRIRNCYDCLHILSFKCVLSVIMLVSCLAMLYLFMKALLFVTDMSYPIQYDYIIVGGGPAGSIITRRLVDEGAKVLLLEAGGASQYSLGGTDYFSGTLTRFDIPLLWTSIWKFSSFYWTGFNTTQMMLTKGLGGCGLSSGMIYMRALASDITGWGVDGWTWEGVSGKYKGLETFTPVVNSSSATNEASDIPWYHGTLGPMTTSIPQYIDQVASIFLSAASNFGLEVNNDFNNPDTSREGVGYYHFNVAYGQRVTAAQSRLASLLTPAGRKPNFFLSLDSTVMRVLLSRETVLSHDQDISSYRAVGVEYRIGCSGTIKTAYLTQGPSKLSKQFTMDTDGRRHVILTAGAILSPKLLMNSGIGPREVLEDADIAVKVASPQVGRNLQDHYSVGMVFALDDSVAAKYPTSYSFADDLVQYLDATQQSSSRPSSTDNVDYGVLGSTGHSVGAFLVSPYASDSTVPDIQITVYPTVSEPHFAQTNWRSNCSSCNSNGREMLVTISLLSPEGRLRVVLDNVNPFTNAPFVVSDLTVADSSSVDCPLTSSDIMRLSWAVDRVRSILSTRPMDSAIVKEVYPGTSVNSIKEFTHWITSSWFPSSNYVGTAKMATDLPDGTTGLYGDTSNAVLDETLRVRGVTSLMVADASVMPTIPNGNIHATVLVVAEMAADFIISGATKY